MWYSQEEEDALQCPNKTHRKHRKDATLQVRTAASHNKYKNRTQKNTEKMPLQCPNTNTNANTKHKKDQDATLQVSTAVSPSSTLRGWAPVDTRGKSEKKVYLKFHLIINKNHSYSNGNYFLVNLLHKNQLEVPGSNGEVFHFSFLLRSRFKPIGKHKDCHRGF